MRAQNLLLLTGKIASIQQHIRHHAENINTNSSYGRQTDHQARLCIIHGLTSLCAVIAMMPKYYEQTYNKPGFSVNPRVKTLLLWRYIATYALPDQDQRVEAMPGLTRQLYCTNHNEQSPPAPIVPFFAQSGPTSHYKICSRAQHFLESTCSGRGTYQALEERKNSTISPSDVGGVNKKTQATVVAGAPQFSLPNLGHALEWLCASRKSSDF